MHDKDVVRGVTDIILLGMNILHVHSLIDEIHCHTQHWHKLTCLCSLTQAKASLCKVSLGGAAGTEICIVSML